MNDKIKVSVYLSPEHKQKLQDLYHYHHNRSKKTLGEILTPLIDTNHKELLENSDTLSPT